MSSAIKYAIRAFCFSIALTIVSYASIYAQPDTNKDKSKRYEIVLVDYKGAIKGQLSWSKFETFQGLIQGKFQI